MKFNISDDKLKIGLENILDYCANYSSIYNHIKDSEIKVTLIQEKYLLEGIADLVIEQDNNIEIIDFKTGKKPEDETTYINQLMIYSYLLGIKYNKPITKCVIFYINEEKNNKTSEIIVSPDKIKAAIKSFNETAIKIISNDLNKENKSYCNLCILKKFCN